MFTAIDKKVNLLWIINGFEHWEYFIIDIIKSKWRLCMCKWSNDSDKSTKNKHAISTCIDE